MSGGAFSSNARDLFSVAAGRRHTAEPPSPPPPLPLLPGGQSPSIPWIPAANARELRTFETATRVQPTPYQVRLDAAISAAQAKAWLDEDDAAASELRSKPGAVGSGGAMWVPPGQGASRAVFSVAAASTGVPTGSAAPRASLPSFADRPWVPTAHAREPREMETATRLSPSPFVARLGADVTAAQVMEWAAEDAQRGRASSPALLSRASPGAGQATRDAIAPSSPSPGRGDGSSAPSRGEGRAWVPPGQASASACFSVSPGRRMVQ